MSCNRNNQNSYVEEEPKLIVEVLSSSTAKYDRLGKLDAYTCIPSLEEYLLVDQADIKADPYRRNGEQWVLTRYVEGDTLHLASIDYSVGVNTVYQDVVGVI